MIKNEPLKYIYVYLTTRSKRNYKRINNLYKRMKQYGEQLKKMDTLYLNIIEKINIKGIIKYQKKGKIRCCDTFPTTINNINESDELIFEESDFDLVCDFIYKNIWIGSQKLCTFKMIIYDEQYRLKIMATICDFSSRNYNRESDSIFVTINDNIATYSSDSEYEYFTETLEKFDNEQYASSIITIYTFDERFKNNMIDKFKKYVTIRSLWRNITRLLKKIDVML